MKRLVLTTWLAWCAFGSGCGAGIAYCDQSDNVVSSKEQNEDDRGENMTNDRPQIATKEAAVEVAAKCLGLVQFDAKQVTVQETSFWKESVPFLRDELLRKEAFRIVFDNLDLAQACGRQELRSPHIKSLVVFVARESGLVLKVTSVWPKDVARIAEFPNCAEEERQMGKERFIGIPKEFPGVSLAKALEKTQPWSPEVKQIHAYLVEHSCAQYQNRQVWVIQLRGIAPIPFSMPEGGAGEIPVDARNHMRNIVDASTGEWLFADTIPQPVGPVEFRY